MGEEKKTARKADYRAATFRLPPDVVDRLDAYSDRTGTVKGFVVEQALRQWLDEHDVPQARQD